MNRFGYIPHTREDREEMLAALGLDSTEALFADIPDSLRLQQPLAIPPAMSELALARHLERLAGRNQHLGELVSFLGAGAYEHYQPSVVDAIVSRSEFYTSYTPYQPEMSQGLLQAIFEYQTMIAEWTGMDLANASMYDGPTAFAEAGLVACAHTRRNRLLIADNVHPEYRRVLETYASGQGVEVLYLPADGGQIEMATYEGLCDETVAGVMIQYPNFFGVVEDVRSIAEKAHGAGALLIVNTYPIALGLLEAPGNLGADIVVAEGQSLGNSLAYGGPYLGIMAVKAPLMRRIPGRVVGQTTDADGRRGFVLTLQAREQHIRREKATSNICSNQSLCALAATVFMSYMGKAGMQELAQQNFHKAHYLRDRLLAIDGVKPVFSTPFFNEFALQLPKSVADVQVAMLEAGYLFGYDLSQDYPQYGNSVLLTVTEMRTREEMDEMVQRLKEVLAS
ncbi:glycine dehydrogenase (decarboxylating) [Alicyclobacillus hesperidum URH17-3-68]|uniref:Probable glycine dehydrogenase (decarboxylating) subunit 1 n=1 Tax=Alicyclobacillus hesperidum TaxID=89784 RepID=A0A1H2T5Y7_9BACL|nr:aminomethyl-transferring glycine dehydrogenase subunit GcvPA [Alicyclobacillus hesperidum]EJY55935.1 glycine dehydrogenase (decarboxylating) [Alicyclobacillus hesperidum URH17-3-68]GLV13773.1 putative glycine dehydrogenase (decarboxylating) subunit 1 [Alicyclobacillus hesperidum]SDW39258.1 glycine dehydrogenase (decarboxylating) alpha subunit [Alicyclobacillus hesperidum]